MLYTLRILRHIYEVSAKQSSPAPPLNSSSLTKLFKPDKIESES